MLELQDVHTGYGRTEVVHGVDLTVGGDAVVALLGHNGAGKTTLLRAVVGLNRVTSGRILLDGEDITGLGGHARVRRGMAYVPQGQRSFGGLSVRENLQVVADGRRNGRAAVDRSLAMFPALEGLLERRAGLLSGGQRQQLAIARALITEPSLLILDEPTEGIQPSVVQEIEQKILQLAAGTGIRVLLVEQRIGFALGSATDWYVLDSGRVSASGRAGELAEEHARAALAL
ncbi:ATP-binding cassette domain-containing protein [Kocuria rosea]|uniref:ATP-binding cassette domain-containing protein n=1 Tax=Kocuria rosea TaxID=1275 RepID=UPI00232F3BAB|nr:ATP-binding cassette domain-containing protein [Kocuria rosea]